MVIIVYHVSIRRVWFLLVLPCHLHFRKTGGRKEGRKAQYELGPGGRAALLGNLTASPSCSQLFISSS